jgi:expansin (peptidoglycan-binding protein)
MTRSQAEQTAISLREAGWPVVYVEINDDGTWQAVTEDWAVRDGWLKRRLSDPEE